MDQVRQGRDRLLKRNVGKRLVGSRNDAVIRGARVGDDSNITLWHMAADAVVCRLGLLPGVQRQLAALFGVAGEALAVEIGRCFFMRRLSMRVVTGDAAKSALARPVALTQSHGIVMLDVVRHPAAWPESGGTRRIESVLSNGSPGWKS